MGLRNSRRIQKGDLVMPHRRTGHHMMGIVVAMEKYSSLGHAMVLIHFHKPHINSEGKWVDQLWFMSTEVEIISEFRKQGEKHV